MIVGSFNKRKKKKGKRKTDNQLFDISSERQRTQSTKGLSTYFTDVLITDRIQHCLKFDETRRDRFSAMAYRRIEHLVDEERLKISLLVSSIDPPD